MAASKSIVVTSLSEETREALEVAFDGYGTSASGNDVLDDMARQHIRNIEMLAACRIYFGTSGAMRWPWSQEAPISPQPPKIGEF